MLSGGLDIAGVRREEGGHVRLAALSDAAIRGLDHLRGEAVRLLQLRPPQRKLQTKL